jgi:hypothetical protein
MTPMPETRPMPRHPHPLLLAAAGLALCLMAAPAAAQGNGPNGPPRPQPGTPLQDLQPADTLMAQAGRWWDGLLEGFGFGDHAGNLMRRHTGIAADPAQLRDDFTALMEVAGYGLKEIESSIGLVPTLSLTFGQSRELTAADREYLERSLARHAERHGGPVAALQRSVVQAVLDASDIGGFAVETIHVELFPVPSVRLTMAPHTAPLSRDAGRIIRALERMQRQNATTGAERRFYGRDLPGWVPAPPLRPVLDLGFH